jgi:ribosomal protein S21
MDHVRLHPTRAKPTRQPEAVAAGFEGKRNRRDIAALTAMKRRRAYEKPSERWVREKVEAIRRHRKALRKRLEREGY